jgi:hypothetical protein
MKTGIRMSIGTTGSRTRDWIGAIGMTLLGLALIWSGTLAENWLF